MTLSMKNTYLPVQKVSLLLLLTAPLLTTCLSLRLYGFLEEENEIDKKHLVR
jgi:hypothetical protein